MTLTPSQKPVAPVTSIASTQVAEHIETLKGEIEQELNTLLDEHDSPGSLMQALGVVLDPSIGDEEAQTLLSLRLGINLLPKVMGIVLGVGLNDRQAQLDQAVTHHRVTARKSAARYLTDSYDLAAVPTSKVAGQAGMVEALKPTVTQYGLYVFSDGSGFLKIDISSENRAFSQAWAQALSSPIELREDTRTSMETNFHQAIAQMVEQDKLSAEGRRVVRTMVDGMVVDLMRMLATSSSMLVPLDTITELGTETLLSSLAERENPSVWRSGVDVLVDDAIVASPNALRAALGVAPRASLQESLARLNLASTAGDAA